MQGVGEKKAKDPACGKAEDAVRLRHYTLLIDLFATVK
jgi:hypothetical protein